MQDVEEYEFEELFTREQLAEFFENLANQLRKGFKLEIKSPVKKDGNITIMVSDTVNVKMAVMKRKTRSILSITLHSEPIEIPSKEVEEGNE